MKPSSLRTWATAAFSLVAGISTAGRSIRLALRMRVSMSANGSVIMVESSPARLHHARNQAVARHIAEADTADAKFTINGPRPAAQLTAEPDADALTRRHLDLIRRAPAGFQLGQLLAKLHVFRCGCHDC